MRVVNLLLLLFTLVNYAQAQYQRSDNGIIVTFKQEADVSLKKMMIDVIDDNIIRVCATPDGEFSSEESLMIIPYSDRAVDYTVDEVGDDYILKTSALSVCINKKSGEVVFRDHNGRVILQEREGGGKSFSPVEIDGVRGYETRSIFESAQDEAFYGLGQHQSDEFNYKGRNESLYQYNTKISVPFVVSNKNYGILWDDYSLGRFGDPRDYAQLNKVFKLYDKSGNEGGLSAKYTSTNEDIVIERIEDSIFYEDIKSAKNLPAELPLMGSNVVYSGDIMPNESGKHHFNLYYAGYVKVYIDNELIVPERWRTAWNPNSYKFNIDFEAGERVPIRIEWIPDGGESYLGLRVLSPVEEEEQNRLSIFCEMSKAIDYYFIYGDSMDDVIGGYRTLTGKSPIMPKWAFGYWQSRERYKSQEEILGALKGFRDRRIPIDNIVLDWNYWEEDAWGSHEFDKVRFPDPKGMVDSIHALNAQMMISVWPKFYKDTEHFKEFDKNGWMYQQAIKDGLRDWVGPGYVGSFYDAYSEGARKLFWKQLKDHLYPIGIDAWWMDASEPNVKDCTDMDYRKQLCGPTELGPSTQYFNAYSLMNAKTIYEGLREEEPDRRVFQLTRSGFAGLQRYATASWSGDIGTRWEDMKAQISAGLNFSVSGIPYWTMDIGGFCVEKRYEQAQLEYNETGVESEDLKEWRELNSRWYQFGAFTPIFRAHGQYPFREIYNIAPKDHPAYNSILYYTKLRYNLMPYIYSLAGMTYLQDYTIMRPMVMDFSYDSKVVNIGDQYMFGPSIMVAPIYEYKARSREVYFPEATSWYDLYTGRFIEGGQTLTESAAYERIPLYLKSGTILPLGVDMQYVDEKPNDKITLFVYAGEDGEFTLYEDEGTNYNYEKGAYSTIHFRYDDSSRLLTISEREGEFDGVLNKRAFNVVIVDSDNPQRATINAVGVEVKYKGKRKLIKL